MEALSEITNHLPKRRKTDPLWNFLDEIDNKRYCQLCHKGYSIETGLTTIKAHFKHENQSKFNEIFTNNTQIIEPYDEKNEIKIQIMNYLIKWIITDQQAFFLVENSDFQLFVNSLNPRFQLPTRQLISESIIKLYNHKREMLYNFFEKTQHKFSITTDAWTSCTNLGYLAITLHWINENWTMTRVLLDMVPLHERHTGSYITEKVLETITYYNIGARILSVTTDNAANMNVFGRTLSEVLQSKYNNLDFEHVHCAAHVLNLAVSDGMKIIANSITKLRNFAPIKTKCGASYIRKSQPLFEDLKKIFELKGKPFLIPDLDVPTRWNSTYIMIDKMCRIRDMTDILVDSNIILKDRYLNEKDWNEINTIATLLEPMAKATNLLSSSSYPTMGDLHIIFPVILKILNDASENGNIMPSIKGQIARRMYKKLNDYWAILQDCCYLSVVLDPNTKLSSFDNETTERIRTLMYNTYARYAKESEESNSDNTSNSSRNYFKKHLKSMSLTTGNYMHNMHNILEEYFLSIEEDCNVLEFWKVRSTDIRYAGLAQMARDYLIVQATSVPSEQIFSVAKHTISPTRNRLSEENIRASLCLKSWYDANIIE
ncbi:hypothetical protein RirG_211800 [Rhizophagus irregularis DAOM 197198w]|uniref:BED-type domain-containing protein n=3 Tax=Rhizophagus irregularis TaxID=588596 RepID=A0A015JPK4_RHIIW|nr:hypothetical protein RirG_211800 [Rhizophagus irregularis DAOM 197198w]